MSVTQGILHKRTQYKSYIGTVMMIKHERTIVFTFFQGFLRLVQAPRVYPGGGLCVVAEQKTHGVKITETSGTVHISR